VSEVLTFTVVAPLTSWGEVAVGEIRETLDRPTRSAVLGLVAGAMGVDREDRDVHEAMEGSFAVAVHALSMGRPFRDYHTIQVAPQSVVRSRRPATRRELLAASPAQLRSVESTRMAREDAVYSVALWARRPGPWDMLAVADALRSPAFVPYAGRKAHPLAFPMGPAVTLGMSLGGALTRAQAVLDQHIEAWGLGRLRPRQGWLREVHHDVLSDGTPISPGPMVERRRLQRRDVVLDRSRWQFAQRTVVVSELQFEED
jgi:CRISPR system Cascade subunit CasD